MIKMNRKYWKLVDNKPVEISVREFSELSEDASPVLLFDRFGKVNVCTKFLYVDYSMGRSDKPLLFETKINGGVRDVLGEYTSDYETALEYHKKFVRMVNGNIMCRFNSIMTALFIRMRNVFYQFKWFFTGK